MSNIDKMLHTNNWFSFKDFYSQIASINEYRIFVELGVWKGHSISYLAKLLKDKKDIKVYAVDIFEKWDKNESVKEDVKYINQIYNTNLKNAGVREIISDIKSISWDAANLFKDNSIDFVFIDADHSYESVTKDINSWLPKIKKGGIISGHDYFTSPGVKSAVDELLGNVESDRKQNIWYKKV
jgi:predicted O-methyltransferase YrrM